MADPEISLDPRLTPARPDLAAKHLQGKVKAERFVEGIEYDVTAPIASVRHSPSHDAGLDTEALKGERVTIYDRNAEGWAWGQLQSDGYVGWLPEAALELLRGKPTHKVTSLRTFAFPGPSIKLPPVETFSLGAQIEVLKTDGAFAVTRQQHFVSSQHVAPLDDCESDFVAVAERFVGTPYLWGGNPASASIAQDLFKFLSAAAGANTLRDSDMQEASLGKTVPPAQWDKLQRGDLIFWKGHVAIVRDGNTIVHANAYHMATAIEDTREAIARIKASGSDVTSIKRMG